MPHSEPQGLATAPVGSRTPPSPSRASKRPRTPSRPVRSGDSGHRPPPSRRPPGPSSGEQGPPSSSSLTHPHEELRLPQPLQIRRVHALTFLCDRLQNRPLREMSSHAHHQSESPSHPDQDFPFLSDSELNMLLNMRMRPMSEDALLRRRKPNVIGKPPKMPEVDPGRDDTDFYQIISKVGEGTYGEVFKAMMRTATRELKFQQFFALKKLRIEDQGFPISAVREIKVLRQLRHMNIISLREISVERRFLYMVFDFMNHNLAGLLRSELVDFNEQFNALIMKQLLYGLSYCHSMNFLHRDIKSANILINNRGQVKLADLGLARYVHVVDTQRPYTNKVVSLWYRPPELLLGEVHYGPAIDVWSCGCILGEVFQKEPLFQGIDDMSQLEEISRLCGTPSPANWPRIINLPRFVDFEPETSYARNVRNEFEATMPEAALDLLDSMLALDPSQRISAQDALTSTWLCDVIPEMIPVPYLPRHLDCHETRQSQQREAT